MARGRERLDKPDEIPRRPPVYRWGDVPISLRLRLIGPYPPEAFAGDADSYAPTYRWTIGPALVHDFHWRDSENWRWPGFRNSNAIYRSNLLISARYHKIPIWWARFIASYRHLILSTFGRAAWNRNPKRRVVAGV